MICFYDKTLAPKGKKPAVIHFGAQRQGGGALAKPPPSLPPQNPHPPSPPPLKRSPGVPCVCVAPLSEQQRAFNGSQHEM